MGKRMIMRQYGLSAVFVEGWEGRMAFFGIRVF
jgi:hypothetical protein